ncbi:hypothetical protein BOTBODRAFT_192614 [Botryobasidium botryosum FD-172 SS1]|uniref:Methyltransferase type 11 domain-containing protein n=1 Tax=Botryobasidium botryosum (strain FD-172 SS1) TaxID=930990 RepID=A0A067LVB6_BOTB1|nr:hypothetical protein BOTBODRAFT_192614 [Botryobasidium botryosum FD-172 SS1]
MVTMDPSFALPPGAPLPTRPRTISVNFAKPVPDSKIIGREDVHALTLSRCRLRRRTHAPGFPQHLGDPVQALREIRHVTKPGGIVAVRDATSPV